MAGKDGDVHRRYDPSQDRRLSTAILDAVEAYTGEDIAKSEFRLYDSVDPDALDRLFRYGTDAETTVHFDVGDMRVELVGDGGVEIHVSARQV